MEPRRRVYSPADLRRRDLTILTMLSNGKSIREAGEQIGLSESYVAARLSSLRQEFEVANTVALIARALREGVID